MDADLQHLMREWLRIGPVVFSPSNFDL